MTRLNQRISLAGLLALFLVVLASCGEEMEPEDPKVDGEWTGQVTTPLGTVALELGLSENDEGEVTGTMNWDLLGQTGSAPVTGTHKYPDVTLTLSIMFGGAELTGSYTAKLNMEGNRMEGTFTSADGTVTAPVTMTRKVTTS